MASRCAWARGSIGPVGGRGVRLSHRAAAGARRAWPSEGRNAVPAPGEIRGRRVLGRVVAGRRRRAWTQVLHHHQRGNEGTEETPRTVGDALTPRRSDHQPTRGTRWLLTALRPI